MGSLHGEPARAVHEMTKSLKKKFRVSHVGRKAPISLHQSHLYWYTYNELWLDETEMRLKAYCTMELDHDVHDVN